MGILNALLLLTVFTVTLVPYNAFHRHEEDVHAVAMLAHDDAHHCELDEYACHPDLNHPCDHTAHLSAPLAKCFSCHFHFVQDYQIGRLQHQQITFIAVLPDAQVTASLYTGAAVLELNKGPPSLA